MVSLNGFRESDKKETKAYTYDEAMELTGHGKYNYLLLAACCIITNAVAQDMFGFSIIVAAASCDLKLGLTETGVLASAPFVGVIFAYPWGFYADTRGRRKALLLSTIVGFIFAAISSLSPNWQLMMLFKIIASSFSNASFSLTMTILGECTGSSHRDKYLFVMNSANLLSECVTFGLAYFLLPLQFSFPISFLGINYRAWRLYTLVLALPLGFGGLMIALVYESPKFLASRGDMKKALEVLIKMYHWNGGKNGEYPVEHLLTTDNVTRKQDTSFWQSVVKQTVPIFKPPLLWRTIQIFYLMAICCSTNNAFTMWYPTIVNIFFESLSHEWSSDQTFCERMFGDNSTGLQSLTGTTDSNYICNDAISPNTIYSGMLCGLCFCIITLVVSKVASRKRLVLISWLMISAISGTLVNIYEPTASLVFFILLQGSVIGLPSLAAYCVDLYPTALRGMVTSLGMMVARISSMAGINIVGAVITTHCSLTFYTWSIFVLSGVVLSFFLPSDKKINRDLK